MIAAQRYEPTAWSSSLRRKEYVTLFSAEQTTNPGAIWPVKIVCRLLRIIIGAISGGQKCSSIPKLSTYLGLDGGVDFGGSQRGCGLGEHASYLFRGVLELLSNVMEE